MTETGASWRHSGLNNRDIGRIVDGVGASPELVEQIETPSPVTDTDRWVYRPPERIRIIRRLLLADGSPWVGRFGLLLGLSVVIATLGLANDQPAAVIAAMVVAPMMTPVLGAATSLTLGLARQTTRLLLIVTVASVIAVALAWVISASLVVHELTAEELSRTTPRIRDVVIALAAGAAGMYSIVRKDLSGVVPGVAIAVALVPPLATVGLLLELGEWSLAGGAALLYGINVLAIILAAVVVLLVTDFIASPSMRDPKVLMVGAVLVAAAVAIAIPVRQNSLNADRDVTFTQEAESAVTAWEDLHPAHRIVATDIEPGEVRLVIAGETEPVDLGELKADMATDAFTDPTLEIDWVESSIYEVDTDD